MDGDEAKFRYSAIRNPPVVCTGSPANRAMHDVTNQGGAYIRRSIILATASIVAFAAQANVASAASADEAMKWLAGRWTNKGDCGIGSIQFQRSGSGWTVSMR